MQNFESEKQLLPRLQKFLSPLAEAASSLISNIRKADLAKFWITAIIIRNYNSGYHIIDQTFYKTLQLTCNTKAEGLENFIIEFYSANNWAETSRLFDQWKKVAFLQSREKEFEASLAIIRNNTINDQHIAIVVINTLIAQLDGIIREFCV